MNESEHLSVLIGDICDAAPTSPIRVARMLLPPRGVVATATGQQFAIEFHPIRG